MRLLCFFLESTIFFCQWRSLWSRPVLADTQVQSLLSLFFSPLCRPKERQGVLGFSALPTTKSLCPLSFLGVSGYITLLLLLFFSVLWVYRRSYPFPPLFFDCRKNTCLASDNDSALWLCVHWSCFHYSTSCCFRQSKCGNCPHPLLHSNTASSTLNSLISQHSGDIFASSSACRETCFSGESARSSTLSFLCVPFDLNDVHKALWAIFKIRPLLPSTQPCWDFPGVCSIWEYMLCEVCSTTESASSNTQRRFKHPPKTDVACLLGLWSFLC